MGFSMCDAPSPSAITLGQFLPTVSKMTEFLTHFETRSRFSPLYPPAPSPIPLPLSPFLSSPPPPPSLISLTVGNLIVKLNVLYRKAEKQSVSNQADHDPIALERMGLRSPSQDSRKSIPRRSSELPVPLCSAGLTPVSSRPSATSSRKTSCPGQPGSSHFWSSTRLAFPFLDYQHHTY